MTTQTQHDLAPANQPEFELTVTPVPDEQRIDFWPQYFGAIPQWLPWSRIFSPGWTASVRPTAVVSGRSTPSAMAARLWPRA
jgi:hypothetical protein